MKDIETALNEHIFPILPPHISRLIKVVPANILNKVTEVRLRVDQPLLLVLGTNDIMLTGEGGGDGRKEAYRCSRDDLARTFQLISKNSVYAFEQELRLGYLTINGGHRVGLAGQAVAADGVVRTLKSISSLNIRIAREIRGCADSIFPYILTGSKRILNTLIISPPRCGKTTILRDLVRQMSAGSRMLGFPGVQVGLVDERSEIAACQNGIPSVDLGPRVDVLDACPKATGLLMLIRAMSPQVVVTDELGRNEDADAVCEAISAGVSVVSTAHSHNVSELMHRPYIGRLVEQQYFDRYVILSARTGPGTVEEIIDFREGNVLYSSLSGVEVCG